MLLIYVNKFLENVYFLCDVFYIGSFAGLRREKYCQMKNTRKKNKKQTSKKTKNKTKQNKKNNKKQKQKRKQQSNSITTKSILFFMF